MPRKGNQKRGKKNAGAGPSAGLRLCTEEGEQYAVVARVLGGPNCQVVCQDGQTRLCVIRNKFRWRNKSHNRISPGTWVIVGVRDWETTAKGDQKCDVLEVYADGDVAQVRQLANVDLLALENATQAARPGQGAGTTSATDVVFTHDADTDVDVSRVRVSAQPISTFGEEDEIDMDEI